MKKKDLINRQQEFLKKLYLLCKEYKAQFGSCGCCSGTWIGCEKKSTGIELGYQEFGFRTSVKTLNEYLNTIEDEHNAKEGKKTP